MVNAEYRYCNNPQESLVYTQSRPVSAFRKSALVLHTAVYLHGRRLCHRLFDFAKCPLEREEECIHGNLFLKVN